MNLYEVKLIWRDKKSRRYRTITLGVKAENAFESCARAAHMLARGEVDNVRAKPTHRLWLAHGEPSRRCKWDKWDGFEPGDFLPVTMMDTARPGWKCHDAEVVGS